MSSGAGHSRTDSGPKSPVFSPTVSSPLSRAPKFSPPSSRNSSPIRRPLHERSNSQTNQYGGPTIRIVEDSGPEVYSKTPFPSQPSQILPPRKKPGYAFEGRGPRVSDENHVANVVAKFEASQSLVPKPLQHKKAIRHSTSTSNSDADTLVAPSFSPSSSRFSQGSTPPSSIYPDETTLEILEEDVALSQPPPPLSLPQAPPAQELLPESTIRAVPPSAPPSSSGSDPLESHALTPRASAASLASTASADTLTDRPSSSNWQAVSHPSSSGSDERKQASSTDQPQHRPLLKESIESLAISDTSSLRERPRSSSLPSPTIHDARQAVVATGVRLHYPSVRAPSASSLRATSDTLPNITSRMNDRASQVHQWSSQLSTIPSESERGSRSLGRSSQSFDARSQSQDQRAGTGRENVPRLRRQTFGSISSSDNVSTNPTESSVAVPLPLFSPVTRPSNDDRDSTDERQDTISPLQSPPLRNKRSFLRRQDSDARSNSSRPGSAQSDLSTFIANTIPPWARVYYRCGERNSLGAPDSSTESSDSLRLHTANSGRSNTPSEGNFPLSIYRPRNRPHRRASYPETASMSDGGIIEHEVYVIGPPRHGVAEPFTPRLQQDRRSQARLSAWKAPSLDESLGTLFFSRQNRQVWLFCLGFILPLAWMIASFLPLPPNPEMELATPSQMDVERQFDRTIGPINDRSYQKAVWWRNLNRIMSGIGTLLIGVIIALAILASRMS